MLHAGVLMKLGAYAIIRLGFSLCPEGAAHWMPWVAVIAMMNIIYGGLVAMALFGVGGRTEEAEDENDIALGAFFASIALRENLGKLDCSFAEMVERVRELEGLPGSAVADEDR